jgi:hypothetical protein
VFEKAIAYIHEKFKEWLIFNKFQGIIAFSKVSWFEALFLFKDF